MKAYTGTMSQSHRTDQGSSDGGLSKLLILHQLSGLFLLPPKIQSLTGCFSFSTDREFEA